MMMVTLQAYFDYWFRLDCGIPSVTLLGTREDWVSLRQRIDKLDRFGDEPRQWASLLRPVCDSFVACFDTSALEASILFWSRVCHRVSGGSGPTYLCGWATVFCVWDNEGNWQGSVDQNEQRAKSRPLKGRVADHISWPFIDNLKIPRASVEVPVLVNHNGVEHITVMITGLAGIHVGNNGQGEDAIAPVTGWAMYNRSFANDRLKKMDVSV